MSLSSRHQAAAVLGVAGAGRDVDEGRVAHHVGALQPRELDDLLDEPREPVGLDADALGEARDDLGVVVGVEDRLGQQGDAADRGLELVAHVGEEVAADLLDPGRLGAVLDEQQHVVGSERRDARGDDEPARTDALAQVELGLADHAVTAHRPGEVEQLRVHELVVAHEAVRHGGRRVVDDPVGGVDDDAARAEHRDDVTDARRHGLGRGRVGVVVGGAVREAHGDEGHAPQGEAGDATQGCRRRRIHENQGTHLRVHAPTTWAQRCAHGIPTVHLSTPDH